MDEKLRNELAADLESNIEPQNQELIGNPGEPEDPDKFIYITVSSKLFRENVECKDGKRRALVSVPKGITFNGKDITGYIFFPPEKLIHENKYIKGTKVISYPNDFTINLLNKDEILMITPTELKAAFAEGFRKWQKTAEKEQTQETSEKKTSLTNQLAEAKENVEKQEQMTAPENVKAKEASL